MSWEAPRFSRKGVKQKILSDFLEWDTTERIAEKTKWTLLERNKLRVLLLREWYSACVHKETTLPCENNWVTPLKNPKLAVQQLKITVSNNNRMIEMAFSSNMQMSRVLGGCACFKARMANSGA